MTLLQVMTETNQHDVHLRTDDVTSVNEALAPHGVILARWDLRDLPENSSTDDVLSAYQVEIEKLTTKDNYSIIDVVQFQRSTDASQAQQTVTARQKFLDEHTHDEDEVRFFARGSGCFYLHLDDRVFAVVCTAGDLLSVPAGTTHWFDMGHNPDFCAIRFFHHEDGWVGKFTGDRIADRMPTLDDLAAPQ